MVTTNTPAAAEIEPATISEGTTIPLVDRRCGHFIPTPTFREQADVYRRDTKLPCGLSEIELMRGYGALFERSAASAACAEIVQKHFPKPPKLKSKP